MQVYGGLDGDGEAELAGGAQQLLESGEVIGHERSRDDLAGPLAFPGQAGRECDGRTALVAHAPRRAERLVAGAEQRGDRVEHLGDGGVRVCVPGEEAEQADVVGEHPVPAVLRRGALVELGRDGDVVDQGAAQ